MRKATKIPFIMVELRGSLARFRLLGLTFGLSLCAVLHLGGCQNDGPFLGTLNIRCRIIIGIQKGTIILTTTHLLVGDFFRVLWVSDFRKYIKSGAYAENVSVSPHSMCCVFQKISTESAMQSNPGPIGHEYQGLAGQVRHDVKTWNNKCV